MFESVWVWQVCIWQVCGEDVAARVCEWLGMRPGFVMLAVWLAKNTPLNTHTTHPSPFTHTPTPFPLLFHPTHLPCRQVLAVAAREPPGKHQNIAGNGQVNDARHRRRSTQIIKGAGACSDANLLEEGPGERRGEEREEMLEERKGGEKGKERREEERSVKKRRGEGGKGRGGDGGVGE